MAGALITRRVAAVAPPAAPPMAAGPASPAFPAPVDVPSSAGLRIFISYAHRDELATRSRDDVEGLPRSFHRMLVQTVQALGDDPAGIFFDLERLRHEAYWSEAIESALTRCDLFFFLVSANAMGSEFCIDRELQVAASLGKFIVPVLLTPTVAWTRRPVPGGTGRKLGDYHSGGLPKDPAGNTKAVIDWPTPDHAWTAMEQDLMAVLDQARAAPRSGVATVQPPPVTAVMLPAAAPARPAVGTVDAVDAAGGRTDPALLPYYCDQIHLTAAFEGALDAWSGEAMEHKALLMLVKGVYEDDVNRLYRRLVVEHLHPWTRGAQRELSDPVEFELQAVEGWKPAQLRPLVVRRLYEALGLTAQQARDACQPGAATPTAALEARLSAQAGVLNLVTNLPPVPLPDCAAALAVLLEHLGQMPHRALLGRLSLAVFIEEPALVEDRKPLASQLKLGRVADWVHVVETAAPKSVTVKDAEAWHRDRKIEDHHALSRPALLSHLVAQGQDSFRLRRFAALVAPLLGRD